MSDRIVYVPETYDALANRLSNLRSELNGLASQVSRLAMYSGAGSVLNLSLTGVFGLSRVGKSYTFANAASALRGASHALRDCADDAEDLAKSLTAIKEIMEKNETHVVALVCGQLEALLEEEAKQERAEKANVWRAIFTGGVIIVSLAATALTGGAAAPATVFLIGAATGGTLGLINSATDQYIEKGEIDGWQLVYDTATGAVIGGVSSVFGSWLGGAASDALSTTKFMQGLLNGSGAQKATAYVLSGITNSVV